MKRLFLVCAVALLPFMAKAQFALGNGEERSSRKWNYIETKTYRVIYPEGLDSLAKVYATELERGVEPVSFSAGSRVNENFKYKWPVVLHAYSSLSNGMVACPPHRMELYTTPNAYDPIATNWERHLTLHESRHVAQEQFAWQKPFKWSNILIGQMSEGLWPTLYGGASHHEGDAVLAETALTNSGRGRSADFLEYLRVALADGRRYSYFEWHYGMLNNYTPDYYRISYVYHAGIRAYYDTHNYNTLMIEDLKKYSGIDLIWKSRIARNISGKRFPALYYDITDSLALEWKKDEERRGPYMKSEKISKIKGRYTDFQNITTDGNSLFAVRSGMTKPRKLVKIDASGNSKVLSGFNSQSSNINYSPYNGRLYWSEYIPDVRWGEESYSDIFFLGSGGSHHRLTKGQRYYNPCPSESEPLLAVVSYPVEGGSSVEVLNIEDGSLVRSYPAPSGFQVVDPVWVDKALYVSAITPDGFGIYRVSDFSAILAPSFLQLKELQVHRGKILFTSDRTGVNELYSLDPKTGTVTQMTSMRFGANDFRFNYAGDTLYYSSLETKGRYVAATLTKDLMPKVVDFKDIAEYPMVSGISKSESVRYDENATIEVSEPKKYSKFGHAFRIHSWLPLYFDKDNISSISFSDITQTACIGATVYSQNELNTAYGSAAYKLEPTKNGIRHAGTISYTYAGLYPVFETKLSLNHRDAINYFLSTDEDNSHSLGYIEELNARPNFTAFLRAYIPFNFSRGGWQKGVIPSLSYTYTNDRYINSFTYIDEDFVGAGSWSYMSKLTASLRAYIVEPIASSKKYPNLGIGAEVGYACRPEVLELMSGGYYAYLYGYLPGFFEAQGFRLSALYQHQTKKGFFTESLTSIVPRGYKDNVNVALSNFANTAKFSLDYNIPFLQLDLNVLNLVYLRNLEIEPHFDFTSFTDPKYVSSNLWSVGADLLIRIQGNNKASRVGLSFNYLSGSLYPLLHEKEYVKNPFAIGLAMNMSL